MSENEIRQPETQPESETSTVSSETTTPVASTKKAPLKLYAISITVVALVILAVLFMLEKEGRSNTNLFSAFIANQENNKVVAVVNGDEIVNKELETSINQFSQMATAQGVDITTEETKAEIRKQSLDVLINTQLLKQSAAERGISVSDEAVENRIEEIKIELGGEEVLSGRMTELGIDIIKLRSDIKDEILIQTLLDEIFAEENIEVSEEEISAVYEGAGGTEAGLPEIEEVRGQIIAQITSTKEQEIIDGYLIELKEDAEIEIVE